MASQYLQQSEVEAPASDGGMCEHLARLGAKFLQSLLYGDLHAAWEMQRLQRHSFPGVAGELEVASRHHRLQQLFDEERVALGDGIQRLHKWSRWRTRRIEYRPDHGADIAEAQA